MCSKKDVEEFLKDFIYKLDFWGLVIRTDRTNPKNLETLLALSLKYVHVKEILKQLEPKIIHRGRCPTHYIIGHRCGCSADG